MRKSISTSSALKLALLASLALTGCADKEKKPLPGTRISVLELQKDLVSTDAALNAQGFVSPEAWKNDYWTQAGGYANHAMQNVALNEGQIKEVWSTDIGAGSSEDLPLTAQPVVFEGFIYAMDAKSAVSAYDVKSGKQVWKNYLQPKGEDEDVIGGGLAISSGVLYATSGYDELIAMNPKKGGIFWRSKLTAPSRAAPTVVDNKVYVITLDNNLTAFDALSGKKLWKYEGFSETASLVAAASPAVANDIVIAPMSSGEVAALRVENGSVAWSDTLSPSVQTGGSTALPDIAGMPVIDQGAVIAVSNGGKIVSIDQTTGQRIWTRDIGGASTPWVAGNMIFMLTSHAELAAIGRDTGTLAWVKPLSDYDAKEENNKNSLLWTGPILAGNRLILTSAGDSLIEISPTDGSVIRKIDLGFHVAVPPVVAGGILYLVSDKGTLSAWQ